MITSRRSFILPALVIFLWGVLIGCFVGYALGYDAKDRAAARQVFNR